MHPRPLLAALALAACHNAPAAERTLAPDLGRRLVADHGMVTSASPYASEAGLEILRQGGNAVDAAVATAFAIGVAEPEMSGVGGSGAMVIWTQSAHKVDFLDFYAAQPTARFKAANAIGRDSTTPLRIVGIPGNVAGLLAAHEKYGKLPRATVMAPAIRLAAEGYPMYQVLADFIAMDSAALKRDPVARSLFWPGGHILGMGDHYANPALAAVLRRIAEQGRDGFYKGETARAVVARMNEGGHPATLDDFAAYQPNWRRPLCTDYRGEVVLSAPPPEGGMQVLTSLSLLERFDMKSLGLPTSSPRAFDAMTSAMRIAQASARVNSDPRWQMVPARGMISDAFAAQWADVVGTGHAADTIRPRDARAYDAATPAACAPYDPYPAAAAAAEQEGPLHPAGGETTHIAVVDNDGNAVSVTVTNSSAFGSRAAVLGFFLNDSGWLFRQADFARTDAPAWRTRITTIAPSIFLRDGRVQMVVGSPGGGRIPLAMLQVISYVVDYGLDPLEAVRMPRIYPTAQSTRVEIENGFEPSLLAGIRAMGYEPIPQGFGYARLYLIVRVGNHWVGAADPRHDGEVRGY